MGLVGPVLAASHLSKGAEAAIRQGRALASELHTQLVICHVLPEAFRARVLFPQDAGPDTAFQQALEQKAHEALRSQIDAVVGRSDESIVIESGSPHAGILAVADRVDAGVILAGPGVTALRVARAAARPVIVARPSPAGAAVLGATDFSDPALPAIHMAADEAQRRRVRLRVVHCLDVVHERASLATTVALPGAVFVSMPPDVIQQLEASALERLRETLGATGATGDATVLHGSPARCIVETARDVATSLIVVGTHGRTGLARLALGSVAEQVLADAPCSVLVVPLTR